ncbi:hypothetical protein ACFPJ4_03620 [Lysinimonas soli]|uniref:DUF4345 domain-containing protein n=1 Tax=Lysinimonas soli TaxID=1074233 RepID=A0ABW0NMS6_9MICO
MNGHRIARVFLLIALGFVGVTAVAGGAALVLGSAIPGFAAGIAIPLSYLDGSPFDSYVGPGVILAVVLGGVHVLAFVLLLRRHPYALFAAAVAAFDTLIWIFVELVFIPFSLLQLIYFAVGLAEAGLIMLGLGLLSPSRNAIPSDDRS